jgi:hypothetical protein
MAGREAGTRSRLGWDAAAALALARAVRRPGPADPALRSFELPYFLRGQLAKPGKDRLRAHDLAADPAFLGRQLLALQRQAAPLSQGPP